MSSVLSLTRATLSHAASLYTPLNGHLRESALQAFIMALAFSVACTALLGWSLGQFDLFPEYATSTEDALYLLLFASSEYIFKSFALLALFPFILVQRSGTIGRHGTISFREQVGRLTPPDWSRFFLATGALFLLHLFLFLPLLVRTGNTPPAFGSWDLPSEDGHTLLDQYGSWALDLTGELLHFVPVVLLFLLVHSARTQGSGKATRRGLLTALGATLLSTFLFGALLNAVQGILIRHVFPVVVLPFQGSAFPMILTFMMVLLIGTFAIPFFAACIHFPMDGIDGAPRSDEAMVP